MNRVCLVGRITKDVELRMSTSGVAVAIFTLAVNRTMKKDGEQEADFISCVAFGKTAEFMDKYVKKGYLLSVDGRIQTGSYDDKNGHKVYTTDIMCDSVQNLTPKQSTSDANSSNDFGITEEDLPF